MKIFKKILEFFSIGRKFKKSNEYKSLVTDLDALKSQIETLSKTVQDQRDMIAYLSSIQTELAQECFTVSDTLKKLVTPKKSAIRIFTSSVTDDDDFLN